VRCEFGYLQEYFTLTPAAITGVSRRFSIARRAIAICSFQPPKTQGLWHGNQPIPTNHYDCAVMLNLGWCEGVYCDKDLNGSPLVQTEKPLRDPGWCQNRTIPVAEYAYSPLCRRKGHFHGLSRI
jgi:hypothetical protein